MNDEANHEISVNHIAASEQDLGAADQAKHDSEVVPPAESVPEAGEMLTIDNPPYTLGED